MVTYKCKRCGYESYHKSNYRNHLLRKTVCDPIINDIEIVILIEELNTKKDGEYNCEQCYKNFKSSQSKYQHKKKCNTNINMTKLSMQEQILILENEITKLKYIKPMYIQPQNIHTQNIHIHIDRKDFANSENTSYIESDFLLECFRDMDLNKVIEELHFNHEHPENHNVRIKNVKQNLMEYIDNGKWTIKKKEEVLDHLIMNGYRVLHTYYKANKNDIEDELNNEEVGESLEWLRKIYNEDLKLMKELKNDAFILVMNNKVMLVQKV